MVFAHFMVPGWSIGNRDLFWLHLPINMFVAPDSVWLHLMINIYVLILMLFWLHFLSVCVCSSWFYFGSIFWSIYVCWSWFCFGSSLIHIYMWPCFVMASLWLVYMCDSYFCHGSFLIQHVDKIRGPIWRYICIRMCVRVCVCVDLFQLWPYFDPCICYLVSAMGQDKQHASDIVSIMMVLVR